VPLTSRSGMCPSAMGTRHVSRYHWAHRSSPVTLGVVGEVVPESRRKLESGTAALLKRGFPLPQDADAVVELADTYRPDNALCLCACGR